VKRRRFLHLAAVVPAGLVSTSPVDAAPAAAGQAALAAASPSAGAAPAPAPRPQTPPVVRAGTGRYGETHRLNGRDPVDLKLSSNDTGGALAVWESLMPGKGGPSFHVHHDVDEWFFVIDGEFVFKLGDALHDVHPGDSVFAPRGQPHTWSHRGTGTGRVLFLVNPAGLLESFFRESATRTRRLTLEEAQQFFEAHGMTLLGPPLAVE
jgi:quercetin 2,3-dioxygenase